MRFLVIAKGLDYPDRAKMADAPIRANRYRERLVEEGQIVVHAHIVGHRAHMWIYDVTSVDELDRLMAEDPIFPYLENSPEILPLASLERMKEREEKWIERQKG